MATSPTMNRTITTENTDPKIVHSAVLSDEESLSPSIQVVKAGADDPRMANYMDELAFLKESVVVTILPNSDRTDTTKLVTIGVNGKQYHFLRGEPRKVPRFVLGAIASKKKESWYFGYDRAVDGSTRQTDQMQQYLRYPHQWQPHNPANMAKEQAWYEHALAQQF